MKNFENDHFINLIIEKVKKILSENKNQSIAHRWDHTDRVYKRSIEMTKYFPNEKLDMELLKISSLLHDINQPFNRKERHVKLSIHLAKKILEDMTYPNYKIKRVLKIIQEHPLKLMHILQTIKLCGCAEHNLRITSPMTARSVHPAQRKKG